MSWGNKNSQNTLFSLYSLVWTGVIAALLHEYDNNTYDFWNQTMTMHNKNRQIENNDGPQNILTLVEHIYQQPN